MRWEVPAVEFVVVERIEVVEVAAVEVLVLVPVGRVVMPVGRIAAPVGSLMER